MRFLYRLLIWKQGEGTILMRVSRRHIARETKGRRNSKAMAGRMLL
jgi:hypothetical protein